MKIWHKILIVLSILAFFCGVLLYDAFYTAPQRFVVRTETISSMYIPVSMDNVDVLFFSDLDYGQYMDEERMDKLVETINEVAPDVVIFGGDVFDETVSPQDTEKLNAVSERLAQIKAPLGKFAILGDTDNTPEMRRPVEEVLYLGDFEIIDNRSQSIHNDSGEAIAIVGIENGVNGYSDITGSFANISPLIFSIVVCHTPDTAVYVPADLTKYMLAGHSHGGQVYWIFGSLLNYDGALQYFRGKHIIDGRFTLDISTGTGTRERDIRFLSNAEVVVYHLEHKAITDQ
ncbi:MAG: metallophosphoesterase [Solobacterium sp.]|nr:metallophosphoesterase [Solobacterium sp.]MBQ6591946.1 metallophosphoesterase [Solobacterium sp.]MBR0479356.1 metallophosphoesterase [Solobacterium sp.]